jgi:ribosomal protein S18 acetylase RimI-like enzyme
MTYAIRLANRADDPALIDLKHAMNRAELHQYPAHSPVRGMLDPSREAAVAGVAAYWAWIADQGGEFFVAERDGAVIGSILWTPFEASAAFTRDAQKMALIAAVVVAEGARGEGLGAALMAHAEGRIRAAGISVAFLEVTHGNVAAQALYAKAGYAALETAMVKRL